MQVSLSIMHTWFCPQIASHICMTVQDLGKSCVEVVLIQVNLCIMCILFCSQITSCIRMTVQVLGKSCVEVVQDAGRPLYNAHCSVPRLPIVFA